MMSDNDQTKLKLLVTIPVVIVLSLIFFILLVSTYYSIKQDVSLLNERIIVATITYTIFWVIFYKLLHNYKSKNSAIQILTNPINLFIYIALSIYLRSIFLPIVITTILLVIRFWRVSVVKHTQDGA